MESYSLLLNLVIAVAAALIAATATATILWYPDPSSTTDAKQVGGGFRGNHQQQATVVDARGMATESDDAMANAIHKLQKSLLPGELAGYTGWARPTYSLAPTFSILDTSWKDKNKWTLQVKSNSCNTPSAQRTKFYARAYGPSIIAGRTTTYDECLHDIAFEFFDAGTYWVEIVVTFSHGQLPKYFPLRDKPDPNYEGYYIPGFPRSLDVSADNVKNSPPSSDANNDKICRIKDVQVTKPKEEVGRWVFDSRPAYDSDVKPSDNHIDLEGYLGCRNAAGVIFKYEYLSNCKVPSQPPSTNQPTFVMFVGDSNFKIQSSYLSDALKKEEGSKNIKVKHVGNGGGMYIGKDRVNAAIAQISQAATEAGAPLVVFFNSGIHDIYQLCSGEKAEQRAQDEKLAGEDYSCLVHYREMLMELTNHLVNLPNKPKVFFQTTTAAFPKWGNYGSVWSSTEGQPYTLSPDFIKGFNHIAVELFASSFADSVTVVDGYWKSYSRPDDRFVDKTFDMDKSFERELVHPGHQVQQAHLNLWMTVLADVMSQQISDANSN